MRIQISNISRSIIVFSLLLLTFISCKKELTGDNNPVTPPVVPALPISSEKIASSISGFVTNENNAAVAGAAIEAGGSTTNTDKYGYFEIKNVQVIKEAAVVTITQAGYFKGIKTYLAKEGKAAFFRIKLLPKSSSGIVNAATGGNITLANGLSVTLPANAVVNATTKAAYTGTVNAAMEWISPTSNDINKTMPDDLRGVDSENKLKLLTTYGMAVVELTGTAGELLQLAAGKKATLSFPIPSAVAGTPPATIALWYFDETNGVWIEQGSAAKTGSNYIGEVSHFSFWNCDVPSDYVNFSCTVVDELGTPLPSVLVKIAVANDLYLARYGYTDTSGYVSGAILGNSQLILDVLSPGCAAPLYTQNIITINTNVDPGNITITVQRVTSVTGTVVTCSNNPVIKGYVIAMENGMFSRHPVDSNGNFSFPIITCGNSIMLISIDNDNPSEINSPGYFPVNAGVNNLGVLHLCSAGATEEYFKYTISDSSGFVIRELTPPEALFSQTTGYFSAFGQYYIEIDAMDPGVPPVPMISFKRIYITPENIQTNSVQLIAGGGIILREDYWNYLIDPVPVYITEYGAVGQFIAGYFSGTFNALQPTRQQFIT